jgi:hypothetical protein
LLIGGAANSKSKKKRREPRMAEEDQTESKGIEKPKKTVKERGPRSRKLTISTSKSSR